MSSGTWGEIKTSYRVVGEPNADEFAGICAALGLRPHQLVIRLVTEGIARYRDDPDVDKVVRLVCEGRRQQRTREEEGIATLNRGQLIDARDRFRGPVHEHPCRECGEEGTALVLPHIDHRRRKRWPQPYWLCSEHSEAPVR